MSHPNVNKTYVNPYLMVADVEAAVAFYEKAFGFKILEKIPGEDGSIIHAETTFRDEMVMFGKTGSCEQVLKTPKQSGVESPVTVCLTTPDVEAFYKQALAHGAVSIEKPTDQPWGARMCRLQDLDGYVWCVLTMKAGHSS